MDFRGHLQQELDRRRRGNPRFSLRAFARVLGIDHATLSQILRGKRRLRPRAVQTIGERLKLDPAQLAEYGQVENERAVLGAIDRPDFVPNSRWLATRLGMPLDAVNVALQRLLRTGALRMRSRDRWEKPDEVKSA